MHRQSIGSPAFKLQNHAVLFAGAGVINDDTDNSTISGDLQSHRKDKLASSPAGDADDEQRKSQKPYKHLFVSSSTKLVHLIPLFTFLCFLILYLSSHDPSRKDLAQFAGFATISSEKNVIDSIDIDDDNAGGFLEIENNNNDALAIRTTTRNLQQQDRNPHPRHRKFGQ